MSPGWIPISSRYCRPWLYLPALRVFKVTPDFYGRPRPDLLSTVMSHVILHADSQWNPPRGDDSTTYHARLDRGLGDPSKRNNAGVQGIATNIACASTKLSSIARYTKCPIRSASRDATLHTFSRAERIRKGVRCYMDTARFVTPDTAIQLGREHLTLTCTLRHCRTLTTRDWCGCL